MTAKDVLVIGLAGTGADNATKITAGMVKPSLTGGITYVDGGGALV
ncbi:hypothetical protein [Nitrospirillum iridis]|uniref:Uncharacterized protein n=1 Tax=Nitrospirillum iridis TaxID=765888 RepID=A0A7X0B4N8_9PROT|nr:hypothetical protein [Nitrospirillum iridis]MBB6255347.1 hypothetical protein [Nitrospirillum iridis]